MHAGEHGDAERVPNIQQKRGASGEVPHLAFVLLQLSTQHEGPQTLQWTHCYYRWRPYLSLLARRQEQLSKNSIRICKRDCLVLLIVLISHSRRVRTHLALFILLLVLLKILNVVLLLALFNIWRRC